MSLNHFLQGHSDSKKRRIDSATRQEFETALLNLYKWLDYIELEISRSEGAFSELSVDEKKVVFEDNVADMESHKAEYEKVLELGERLVNEMKQANESCADEESKIKSVENCWCAINSRLTTIKNNIDFLLKIKQYRMELANLRMMLNGHSKWFEVNRESKQVDLFRVWLFFFSRNFRNVYLTKLYLQVKVKSMKSCEERVSKLSNSVQEISSKIDTYPELGSLGADVQNFLETWSNLLER